MMTPIGEERMAANDSGSDGLEIAVVPFRPDGGAPFLGTIGLFLGAIISGALSGWMVERIIGAWGCCCITGPIQVAVLSFILGGVGGIAVHIGKIRQPLIAGAAGLVGIAASIFGKLFAEYQRFMEAPFPFLVGPDLVAKAKAGQLSFFEYISHLPAMQFALIGIGLLIGVGGCLVLMMNAASKPFCNTCQQWKLRCNVATLGMTREHAMVILDTGRLVELANIDETLRYTDPAIIAHICKSCGTESPIEIELIDIVRNRKGKEIPTSRGIWTYPGWAWLVLMKLFPERLPHPDVTE